MGFSKRFLEAALKAVAVETPGAAEIVRQETPSVRRRRISRASLHSVPLATERRYTRAMGEDSLAVARQLGRIVWGRCLGILDADGRKLKTA